MTGSDMIHLAAAMVILVLTHIFCLAAMTERKYSIRKTALILSSGSPDVYDPAIAQYNRSIVEYWKVENAGIFTANGRENRSKEKWDELYRFGNSLTEKENA